MVWRIVPEPEEEAEKVRHAQRSNTIPIIVSPESSKQAADEEREKEEEGRDRVSGKGEEEGEGEADRESFESAREEAVADEEQRSREDGEKDDGEMGKGKPANWQGDRVRSPDPEAQRPIARRLGPRPSDDEWKADEKWKYEREKEAGEEMPELDESSDEDGVEGIKRGVSGGGKS